MIYRVAEREKKIRATEMIGGEQNTNMIFSLLVTNDGWVDVIAPGTTLIVECDTPRPAMRFPSQD
jgi:hypothetical protein